MSIQPASLEFTSTEFTSTESTSTGPATSAGRSSDTVDRRFVAYIRGLCAENRGAQAALRRAVRDGSSATSAIGFVEPWVPAGAHPNRVEALYLVAALIATHPDCLTAGNASGASVGTAVARSVKRTSLERSFCRLARTDAAGARSQLPRLLASAAAAGALRVDGVRLLRDLTWWDVSAARAEGAGIAWLRDYCRTVADPTAEPVIDSDLEDRYGDGEDPTAALI